MIVKITYDDQRLDVFDTSTFTAALPLGKANMLTNFEVRFDRLGEGGLWLAAHSYQAVADATGGVVEDVDLIEAETEPIGQEAHDDTGTERAESKPSDEATDHDEEASFQGSAEDPQRQGSTVQSKGNSTAPPQNTSQKTWVEETERVWVVDKEAWTESAPIYGTIEISVCNICGTDITGNTSAHAKEHMKAGEGSGHHSETRQKIIGYNTVSHSEEGHWETKAVGGHWE